MTHLDISFVVNRLSQFMHRPTDLHMQATKRVLRYLKGTLDHGLHLVTNQNLFLQAYCDLYWVGDTQDCKSTSTFIIYLGNNPISWSNKKQAIVAKSSTETEYRTIASTTTELIWLQELLKELHFSISQPATVHSDNLGATYFSGNLIFHSRMKHIAIDYHFVRDLVIDKKLSVLHVPSTQQLADLLTKPLPATRHSFLKSKIGVVDPSTILWGHIGVIS
uniref:Copia protein n=1 Tax=Cajanus cajan TaxID=3821 RepID=A0A151RTD3_CAJCA|nr:Copia protein [Cajanus cajan]